MAVDKIVVPCPECKREHAEFVPYGLKVNIRFCLHCDSHFRLQAISDDGHMFVASKCTHQPVVSKVGENPPPPKEKPRFATGGFTSAKGGAFTWPDPDTYGEWNDYFTTEATGGILEQLERIRKATEYKMNPNAKRK